MVTEASYQTMGSARFQKWQDMFEARQILMARRPDSQRKVRDLRFDDTGFSCVVRMGGNEYEVRMDELPGDHEQWEDKAIYCSCRRATKSRIESYRGAREWYRCNHMAIGLYAWQKRLEETCDHAARQEVDERRLEVLPADYPFLDRPRMEGLIPQFDVHEMLASGHFTTNRYFVDEYERKYRFSEPAQVCAMHPTEFSGYICTQKRYVEGTSIVYASGDLRARGITLLCNCEEQRGPNVLCDHLLDQLAALIHTTDRMPMADRTDCCANELIDGVLKGQDVDDKRANPLHATQRPEVYELSPVFTEDDGGIFFLSFLFGQQDKDQYVLSGIKQMMSCYRMHGSFQYGPDKDDVADFASCDFVAESLPWLRLLEALELDVCRLNETARQFLIDLDIEPASLSDELRLDGLVLDRVAAIVGDQEDEVFFFDCYPETEEQHFIMAGSGHLKLRLTIERDPKVPERFPLTSVLCTMELPHVIFGERDAYAVFPCPDEERLHYLGLVDEGELAVVRPFLDAAKGETVLTFTVGLARMRDFYHRVLPALAATSIVEIADHCAEDVEAVLVPDGTLRFRFDLIGDRIICEATAVYGNREVSLLDLRNDFARQKDLEAGPTVLLRRTFTGVDDARCVFCGEATDTLVFDLVTRVIPELERLGTVEVSEAFSARSVRRMPPLRLKVSAEKGLLDLTIVTDDMTHDELLALLSSYERNERFCALADGTLVDLTGDEELDGLLAFLADTGLALEDAVGRHANLPLFRAPYLERLIDERKGIAGDRDETYRALADGLERTRDADFELPAGLNATLRPYQREGYRWLRVLHACGFGGILADEMGLGKTVQTIALLAACAEEDGEPALVVCPASVVYNWCQELARFAPTLTTEAIVGPARERKRQLERLKESGTRVYVTSYDLLRRDVALYRAASFSTVVLDEAQRIKNPAAAVSKAAKAIPSTHRLALTGTPVENRLGDLWSIVDFLMPGFLYTRRVFAERFEQPIERRGDGETAGRLRAMVAPFILRRRKEEVLDDLPARVEQTLACRLEGEQRRLYDAQVVRVRRMLSGMGGGGRERVQVLSEILRLRQLCLDPALVFSDYEGPSAKRALASDLVDEAVDGEHRVLLFSQFTGMLDLIGHDLERRGCAFMRIDGSTPKAERADIARRFNGWDGPAVLLVSLKAAGVGLNLTGADVVLHCDPWWNVAAQEQATGRAHRIGQTREVTVFSLVASETIEERILALQERKRDLADAIVEGGGESLMSMSKEELLALVEG